MYMYTYFYPRESIQIRIWVFATFKTNSNYFTTLIKLFEYYNIYGIYCYNTCY